MKNIHLLPTSQPSRLVKFFTNKFHLCKEILPIQDEEQYQNIYITSDEEIKEGDWLLIIDDFETYVHKHKGDNLPTTYYKKIILTTDQDLIKDGVQAIDDEFLEWFVKNPSCKEVEVEPDYDEIRGDYYKIIIPQEELKQETLEEVAERLFNNFQKENPIIPKEDIRPFKLGFIKGAKCQQDKNKFNEEDMINFHKWAYQKNRIEESDKTTKELLKEWFEQFKKK